MGRETNHLVTTTRLWFDKYTHVITLKTCDIKGQCTRAWEAHTSETIFLSLNSKTHFTVFKKISTRNDNKNVEDASAAGCPCQEESEKLQSGTCVSKNTNEWWRRCDFKYKTATIPVKKLTYIHLQQAAAVLAKTQGERRGDRGQRLSCSEEEEMKFNGPVSEDRTFVEE